MGLFSLSFTHIHTEIYIYIYIHTYACLHNIFRYHAFSTSPGVFFMHTCIHKYTYICTPAQHISVLHTHIHRYTQIYIHTYIHIHMHNISRHHAFGIDPGVFLEE
jgi:hypothetical protein